MWRPLLYRGSPLFIVSHDPGTTNATVALPVRAAMAPLTLARTDEIVPGIYRGMAHVSLVSGINHATNLAALLQTPTVTGDPT
jgi:hypothetical protein